MKQVKALSLLLLLLGVVLLLWEFQSYRQINQQEADPHDQIPKYQSGEASTAPKQDEKDKRDLTAQHATEDTHDREGPSHAETTLGSGWTLKDVYGQWQNVLQTFFSGIVALFTMLIFKIYRQQRRDHNALERAVILAEELQLKDFKDLQPGSRIESNRSPCLQFCLRNRGRSPAWLLECRVRFHTATELPDLPEYGPEIISLIGQVIPQGRGHYRFVPLEESVLEGKTLAEVENGELFLVAYGFVRYRDVFGRVHELGFGQQFSTLINRLSGSRQQFQVFNVEVAGVTERYNYEK